MRYNWQIHGKTQKKNLHMVVNKEVGSTFTKYREKAHNTVATNS